MKISKHQNKSKKIALITSIIVLICIAIGLYWYSSKQSSVEGTLTTSNTQHQKTIDSSVESRVKNGGGSGQESDSSGGVVDTGGKNVSTQSQGISSQSGDMILYSPTPGQNISDGITVKGTSKASTVYYRIKDNVRGVIGSGHLSVKNRLFSGVLSVNTNASEGSFEVYSMDSSGREINNISIKVTY